MYVNSGNFSVRGVVGPKLFVVPTDGKGPAFAQLLRVEKRPKMFQATSEW